MPKLNSKKLNKIILFFIKLPRFLAEHAFFASIAFISIATLWGVLVFYQYSVLVERKELEALEPPLFLDEKSLQDILKMQQERKLRSEAAEAKEYLNPFAPR